VSVPLADHAGGGVRITTCYLELGLGFFFSPFVTGSYHSPRCSHNVNQLSRSSSFHGTHLASVPFGSIHFAREHVGLNFSTSYYLSYKTGISQR